ncbi:histidine kinase [Microbispora triticiradicis]|uniref:sensor histidine kinase n=1 Tax=Microbispora triticiradicis TaxID=2200763 RepID=UPI001AD8118A|nr:histidine kinase [Microbispora triticiradicis]
MSRKASYQAYQACLKDVLLWAVLGLPVIWAGLTRTLADAYTWPEVSAGLAAIGVAVALARSRPLTAMLVTAALWALSVAVRGDPTVFFLALTVMSCLAGTRMPRARPALTGPTAAAVAAAVVVPLVRWDPASEGFLPWDLGAWFFAVTGIGLFGLVPWLAGHARYQGRALARAGWERAERLERERRMLAEQARMRERAAIAREMHDLLGHDLSLVALRIGALEVAPGLSGDHREAAGEARRAVTGAAERLRDIVAVLGDGDAGSVDDDPTGESIGELVRRAAAAGMSVMVHGTPEERIPTPARAVVRQVVREGLTNAAKHSPGAEVRVRLAAGPDETQVTVAASAPDRPGRGVAGGYGLRELAERVRLHGGVLHAGPSGPGEGFTLAARLPNVTAPATDLPGPRPVALDLALARRRARRTRLAAVLVTAVAVAGVSAFVLGFMVYDATTSVLPPAEFAGLRVGQAESEVAAVLPARTRIDDPSWPEPPIPPGSRCRYYGVHPDPFGEPRLYRLCFAEGRLVGKDFLPR